jgi:hypothetical protein
MRRALAAAVLMVALGIGLHSASAAALPASGATAAAPAGAGLVGLFAGTPKPLPMTWACTPPPNLPKHAFYTCGSNSPATYCRGKALDTVCGVSGGYCLYCWQYPGGTPDDFGNLPCNCRNNL